MISTTSPLDYQELFTISRQRYTCYFLNLLINQNLDSPVLRQEENQILQAIRNDLVEPLPSYSWITPASKYLNRIGDYQTAIELLGEIVKNAPDLVKLEALPFHGLFLRKLGNVSGAILSFENGCMLAEKYATREKQAQLNSKLGFALCQIGKNEEGEKLLLDALSVLRESKDYENLCDIYLFLGYLYDDKGDYHNTFRYLNLAVESASSAGLTHHMVNAYTNLSRLFDNSGQLETAIEYAQKAVEIAKKIDFMEADGFGSINLGVLEYRKNNLYESKYYLEYGISIAKQIGHTRMLLSGLMNLSVTVEKMGEMRESIDLLDQAIHMVSELDDPNMLTMLTYEKAASFLYREDWQAAISFFTETYALSVKYGYRDFEGKALFGIAYANKQIGEMDIAIEKAKISYHILSEVEHGDKEKVARFLDDPDSYIEEY